MNTHQENLIQIQLIEKCRLIAANAHQNQLDKAKQAYLYHPLWVSSILVKNSPRSVLKRHIILLDEEEIVYAQCVALLHDVIEDSDVTYEDLVSIYQLPKSIAEAVLILSKTEGEDYTLYLQRVKENKLARIVKLADLLHNSDLNRLPRIKEKDIKRRFKYLKSMLYLWQ